HLICRLRAGISILGRNFGRSKANVSLVIAVFIFGSVLSVAGCIKSKIRTAGSPLDTPSKQNYDSEGGVAGCIPSALRSRTWPLLPDLVVAFIGRGRPPKLLAKMGSKLRYLFLPFRLPLEDCDS